MQLIRIPILVFYLLRILAPIPNALVIPGQVDVIHRVCGGLRDPPPSPELVTDLAVGVHPSRFVPW